MQIYKNRKISFVHGQRGTGQGTGVLHPQKKLNYVLGGNSGNSEAGTGRV